jgi:hypothetical protein
VPGPCVLDVTHVPDLRHPAVAPIESAPDQGERQCSNVTFSRSPLPDKPELGALVASDGLPTHE